MKHKQLRDRRGERSGILEYACCLRGGSKSLKAVFGLDLGLVFLKFLAFSVIQEEEKEGTPTSVSFRTPVGLAGLAT